KVIIPLPDHLFSSKKLPKRLVDHLTLLQAHLFGVRRNMVNVTLLQVISLQLRLSRDFVRPTPNRLPRSPLRHQVLQIWPYCVQLLQELYINVYFRYTPHEHLRYIAVYGLYIS
ncbi:MAG TPA: hypothetical protein VLK82_15085, partial [Candidatus Tectomicrobia bacterium]|nr:hypothetical protein [Candidatus Tectomicrobia bacterium]